jgi:hypothetical protein
LNRVLTHNNHVGRSAASPAGVVRLAESNAMFLEPCMYTEMIFSP